MSEARRWMPVLVAAVWLAWMTQIILSQFSLSNDISKFLADSRDARQSWISRQLANSELTRSAILIVGAESGDRERAHAAADALAELLERRDEVARVSRGETPAERQAIHDLYYPRRFQFAAEHSDTLAQLLSPAGVEQ